MQSEELLRQQVDAINHKNMKDLYDKFKELYGFESGVSSPRGLRKRIIYRLQEIYFGGVEPVDMGILDEIADKDPLANLKVVGSKRAKVCGTKLFRVWKGKKYEVTGGDHGKYILNGEEFKSLSAVARKITGTKWNGKTFFGVKS